MEASHSQIPPALHRLGKYGRIILFGSRATGRHRPDSDYDILVIVDTDLSRLDRLKLAKRIRVQLAEEFLDADVPPKEVDYLKHQLGSVLRNALENGFDIHE